MTSAYEIMSVSAITEGTPGIEFCGQFIAPLTSLTFVNEVINAIETQNYLRLVLKTHKKLSICLVEQDYHFSLENISTKPSQEIVRISYDGMFMGYTDLEQLLIEFKKVKLYILELKNA